jgi:hypothetical protein
MDAAAIASRGTLDKVRLFFFFFPLALRVSCCASLLLLSVPVCFIV